ncbi:hypothetical protein RZP54_24330, partial [Raoultella ornithinolytica]|uniref:hypothetical protein n=1 Tax=Raoultella ornithinolytica TaxID=54291 RepID=UPI00292A926A
KRAYCLKTQPATGETYPKSDLFNKAPHRSRRYSSLRIMSSVSLLGRTFTAQEISSKMPPQVPLVLIWCEDDYADDFVMMERVR